jgi:serine/threonine protein kinase
MLRHVERYGIIAPRYIDLGHSKGRPYLVISYIPGYTLEVLRQHSLMSKRHFIKALLDVAQTLIVLHRHNYVHHDIKPSNIMMQPDGQTILIDWGSACRIQLGRRRMWSLTPDFASIAQVRGETRRENDLYSLGKTLEALLPVSDRRYQTIVERATGSRNYRYQSAEQFSCALTHAMLFDRMVEAFGAMSIFAHTSDD